MGRQLYVLTAAQRALLALRPGPMDTQQVQGCGLHEAVKDLIAKGYADHQRTGEGFVYWLTPAGRAVCPRRRELLKRKIGSVGSRS